MVSREPGPLSTNHCIVKNKSVTSRMFSYNERTLKDLSEIANALNKYFISIGRL